MAQPRLCDTHIHLTMQPYRDDLDEVLDRARKAGIDFFITMGLEEPRNGETWQQALDLALRHDDMKTALAIHPHDASIASEDYYRRFRDLYRQYPETIVAVGETGLDYHYDFSPRDVQQEVFRQHIRLAVELGLPLSIHSREAWDDTLRILREEDATRCGGVFHCYGYGPQEAGDVLDMGFVLGIGGVVTFKKADTTREAVQRAGLQRIILETDGPYLAPVPYRGKRNESAYIPIIARAVADVLGTDLNTVAETTTHTARTLFGIKD